MYESERQDDNNCDGIVARDTEPWFCNECLEYREIDGEEGYPCDYPRECPSDAFGDRNCGYIVCGECHSPLSDRHLAPGLEDY